MKNVKTEAALWLVTVLVVVLWVLVLWLNGTELGLTWDALKALSEVVTLLAICYGVFVNWGWRLPWFQGWLVPLPDLQGTWRGTVRSTWIDPETDSNPQPIEMLLVIRQKFDSINCVTLTGEMASKSVSAIIKDEDGIKRLSYTYTSEPKLDVRHRSAIHNGAATLNIITRPNRMLEGTYWTDRKTTGNIEARFISKTLAERFEPNWKS